MNTVFPYPGGKSYLSSWIIDHFPDHDCYVEPFGGGASVLVNKPESRVEVYNDRDGDVVHFFRVLRERPDELVEWLEGRPYAKDLHEKYGRQFYAGYRPDDDVERAGRFFYLRKAQYAAKYPTMSGFSSCGGSNHATAYTSGIEALESFADRLRRVEIENRDYKTIFDRADASDTLFYCDPPYVEEGDDLYTQDRFDQQRFVETVNDADGFVCISYTDLPPGLEDWHVVERQASQHMNKGHDDADTERTERLVMNYDPDETAKLTESAQLSIDDLP